MKKLRILLTFGLLAVMLLTVAISAYGGQAKLNVCHITGTYDFASGPIAIGHVITIADPAYDSHIAHGDPEVWGTVTLPDGSEVCTAGGAKRVFVTSGTRDGDLGGLDGADQKYQDAASLAGLTGAFKAWLSTDGEGNSAADRLYHSGVPYELVDGTVIADDWADLTTLNDGSSTDYLQAPIDLDEYGYSPAGTSVWTATDPYGMFSGSSGVECCLGWTTDDAGWYSTDIGYEFENSGHTGKIGNTDHLWTEFSYEPCGPNADNPDSGSPENRLYCFEQ